MCSVATRKTGIEERGDILGSGKDINLGERMGYERWKEAKVGRDPSEGLHDS
jgi:hypothetical protein